MTRPTPFAFLTTATLRKRLWLGATALLLFIATAILANNFVSPDKAVSSNLIGHDFAAFYTAGQAINDGRIADLYDVDAIRDYQQTLSADYGLTLDHAIAPWWNPPFYAWVFAPLARLPYPAALQTWIAINSLCAIIASLLLAHILTAGLLRAWRLTGDNDDGQPESITPKPDVSWRSWALIPLLLILSTPFITTLTHGQSGGTSLLLLTLTILAWRADRALLAGLLCGMLFYKPQLAAVVAGMLVLSLGARALMGLLCTGLTLLVVTLITLPGSLAEFVTTMPANLRIAQETLPYLWERHATWLAFWRLLIQGDAVGPTESLASILAIQCGLILGGGLVIAAVKTWRRPNAFDNLTRLDQRLRRQIRLDRLITATLLAMPLMMPFYFDYDLILLAIPATLMARETMLLKALGRPAAAHARLWTLLFICMMISAPLAQVIRINLIVPVLAMLSLVAIARAWRKLDMQSSVAAIVQEPMPVIVRRAA